MKKMQVLMVSTDRHGRGGIASVVSSYIEGGLGATIPVSYLATHKGSSTLSKLWSFFTALLVLPRYLLAPSFRVFHIHTASRSSFLRKSIVARLGKLFGKKIILHLHGAEFMAFYHQESGLRGKRYISNTFAMADRVVVLSPEWAIKVAEISPKATIDVIYNPTTLYTLNRRVPERFVILFLGQIGKRKGFWDLLEALGAVRAQGKDFLLKYGGNGEVERAQKEIDALGLEQHCEYLGWVTGETKRAVLMEAGAYLLPSYDEGLPMGILEAMAAKVPVISCPVGGIPDAISDGENGLLVPPGDVDALAVAITRLIDSADFAADLANRAYQDAREIYSVDVIVPQLMALYGALVEE